MSLNILEATSLIRQISRLAERIRQLERMFQGQPIGTVRIADAAITNAKIDNLAVTEGKIEDLAVTNAKIQSIAAEKILTGDLTVAVDIGSPALGYTRLDGANNRIIQHDGTTIRIVIGDI